MTSHEANVFDGHLTLSGASSVVPSWDARIPILKSVHLLLCPSNSYWALTPTALLNRPVVIAKATAISRWAVL